MTKKQLKKTLEEPAKSATDKTELFSQEGIKNISRFQDVLKRIHIRLVSEGYVIKNGSIEKPKNGRSGRLA